MKKRYWNRKVSALLMAGLVFSALPVHAFAEEAQKSVEAAAPAEQEVSEEKDASTEGDDNAGGTQNGAVSENGTSELKGTEVDTENQGDAGKEAEGDGKTEQETGVETEKDADSGMTTDHEKKDDTENLTEKSSASGTGDAVLKTDAEIQTEENPTDASVGKTGSVTEVKTEAEEEEHTEALQEETLPEEPTLASASDIPMTDTAIETEASLLGTWTVDGYTSLAFYGDGKGAMLLPNESYDFHYTLTDDQLDLDFVSSRARDMRYTISLELDTLQLTSGTGTKSITISLQRVE